MIRHLHPLQPFIKVSQNPTLPSVQEQDFSCKKRLSNRRTDWTLYNIHDVVNQKYLLRQHEKNDGHKKNRAAYDLVCAGIQWRSQQQIAQSPASAAASIQS
jgi:hypothetical protein